MSHCCMHMVMLTHIMLTLLHRLILTLLGMAMLTLLHRVILALNM